jgi:WD40 repeat protein
VLRSFTRVDFFDVATGKRLRHTPLPPPPQKTKLADGYVSKLSPDGKYVAVARTDPDVDNVLAVYDTATGKEVTRMGRDQERFNHFTFAPDGKTVAAVMSLFVNGNPQHDTPIRVWDVSTGKNTVTFAPGGFFYSVLFSPDGKVLAANRIHPKRELLLWDLQTGKELARLSGVQAQAFAPDGKAVAGVFGNTVRLWEVPTGKEIHPFAGHRTGLRCVACAPDGRTIVTSDKDGHMCLWRADSGRLLHAAQATRSYQFGTALSTDARTLAAAGVDSVIRLWDVATGREDRAIRTINMGVGWALAFSPDGRTLAVECHEGDNSTTGLWDLRSGKLIRKMGTHKLVDCAAAFSPDGRILAAAAQDDMIRLWDVATAGLLRQWKGPRAEALAFSPDGQSLALATKYEKPGVRVWETATGQERLRLAVGGVCAVAFAPDGRCLAAAGMDGTVRVWDWPSGQERCCLRGHIGVVNAVAFTPDGRGLVTGGEDARVLVWDLHSAAGELRAGSRDVSEAEFLRLWADLAGGDGMQAHAAIAALTAAGDRAVHLLEGRLPPEGPIDPQRVERLLADLEADDFTAREKATEQLQALAERIEPALRKALAAGPRPESRRRLEQILNGLGQRRLQGLRAVEVLECVGTSPAREVLRKLAQGAADASLTRAAVAASQRLAKR